MNETIDLVEMYNQASRQGDLNFERLVLEGNDRSGYLWIERDPHLACDTCHMAHPERTYRDLHVGYRCRSEREVEQKQSRNPLAGTSPLETVRCWGHLDWFGKKAETVTDDYYDGLRWLNNGREKKDVAGLLAWEKWFTKEGAAERKTKLETAGHLE